MKRALGLVSILVFSTCEKSVSLSLQRPNPSTSQLNSRRATIAHILQTPLVLALPQTSNARNLPQSTGADMDKVGTVEALTPIVRIQKTLKDGSVSTLLHTIPIDEQAFKRIFDEYSDPISYKQKFMDNNAFLVYYTRGFDGPGRPNIEEDLPQRQTLQYGARNEAWIAWQELQVELEFAAKYPDDVSDVNKYLDKMIAAVDAYLQLAPPDDVQQAIKNIK